MLSSQWREMDSSSGKTERKGRKKKKSHVESGQRVVLKSFVLKLCPIHS